MVTATAGMKSPVWFYFKVRKNTRFAKCRECNEEVSRGGNTT